VEGMGKEYERKEGRYKRDKGKEEMGRGMKIGLTNERNLGERREGVKGRKEMQMKI
jgi:hypothetical protein